MLRFLHQLSGVFFTILGLAFFGVEVLSMQGMWIPWSQVLLTTLPLPLAAVGLLYGGLSVTLGVTDRERPLSPVSIIIGVVCILLFAVFAVLRLWPLS